MAVQLNRLALVGLGQIARSQIQALRHLKQFELVAGCDRNPSQHSLLQLSNENIPFFTDLQLMLHEIQPDAVVVSTPSHSHYAIAQQVLNARTALLLEKPATPTLQELQNLISLAQTHQQVFVIAFHAAFAQEVLWFLKAYQTSLSSELQALTGFHCGFYDPYLLQGTLLDATRSLSSSWVDSGINALSIMEPLAQNLQLTEARLTTLPQYPCREIQASVDFSFSTTGIDQAGRGLIETNWALGINRKQTRLFFALTQKEILLDHIHQQVWLIQNSGQRQLLADFSQSYPRLINHYIGVFTDFARHLQARSDNLDWACKLHQLLYAAYEPDPRVLSQ